MNNSMSIYDAIDYISDDRYLLRQRQGLAETCCRLFRNDLKDAVRQICDAESKKGNSAYSSYENVMSFLNEGFIILTYDILSEDDKKRIKSSLKNIIRILEKIKDASIIIN